MLALAKVDIEDLGLGNQQEGEGGDGRCAAAEDAGGAQDAHAPCGGEGKEKRDERMEDDQWLDLKMRGEPGGEGGEPDDERRVGFDEARAVELDAVEDAGGGVEEPCLILALPGEEEDLVEGDVNQQADGRAEDDEPEKRGTRRFRGVGVQGQGPRRRVRWAIIRGEVMADETNLSCGHGSVTGPLVRRVWAWRGRRRATCTSWRRSRRGAICERGVPCRREWGGGRG